MEDHCLLRTMVKLGLPTTTVFSSLWPVFFFPTAADLGRAYVVCFWICPPVWVAVYKLALSCLSALVCAPGLPKVISFCCYLSIFSLISASHIAHSPDCFSSLGLPYSA